MKVSQIREITQVLLDWFEQQAPEEIDFDADYYWMIPSEEIYRLDKDPQEFTLGQLTDEWKELQKTKAKNRIPSRQDFIWLSGLFRAIGEEKITSLPNDEG